MASAVTVLIPLLTDGIEAILDAFHKNGAASAVAAADQVALAVLQESATLKGLTIDWTDPNAVLAYVQTLAPFVPIADPAAPATPAAKT
jgi:threonine/homoserine/homoserine lactone efflux protein